MVKLDVDFAYTETIQVVLRSIRKHGGKIVDFDPDGPGGGNPNILLSFENSENALQFLRERYSDDSEAFNQSRLQATNA